MAAVGRQIHRLQDPGRAAATTEPATLEDAVCLCEGAVLPLQVTHARAADAVWATGDRLRSLDDRAGCEARARGEGEEADRRRGDLDEAVAYCEAAVDPVEARLRGSEMDLAEEQRRRQDAESKLASATRSMPARRGQRAAGGQADALYAPPRSERPDGRPSSDELPRPTSGRGPEQKSCRNRCDVM